MGLYYLERSMHLREKIIRTKGIPIQMQRCRDNGDISFRMLCIIFHTEFCIHAKSKRNWKIKIDNIIND